MAGYIKITYNVSSTTVPTYVALYEKGDESHISVWWDKVTVGSSGGTVVNVEPWAPQGTSVWYYGYQFSTTGRQDLYFFPSSDNIPDEAFKMCAAIVEVDAMQATGITTVGEFAFALCHNLTGVYLTDSITTIGRDCFQQDNSLTTVNIPSGVTQLQTGLFLDCVSLTSFTVPDQVTWVRNSVFSDCTGLQEVKFGSGLTYLGVAVFNRCSALTSITATSLNNISYASDNPDYGPPFYDMATGGTLYYPASREATYGPASGWLKDEEYWLGYYDWNGVATGGTPEPPTPSDVPFVSGQTVTGLCGNVIKAVYKVVHGYDLIKLIDDYLTQVRFKLEDGTDIIPEFYNDSPHRFGYYFQPMDYGWGEEQSGFITVYMTNTGTHGSTEESLNSFNGCVDLVELYVPESVTSIANNFNGCNNLTNLVIAGTVDPLVLGSFDGACIFPYPATYSGVPSIVCLGPCSATTTPNVFSDIGRNGTLYYPTGEDYSSWMNIEGGLASRGWSAEAFTVGTIDCSALTPFDVPDPPIPSGETADSGSTAITENYSGCPLVFDHSASTGTWNTLPTVTTGGTTNDWWITYDVPANDTDSARTITYYYLRYSGQSCSDLVDTVSYTISQAAGSGTPTPSDRWMYLDPTGRTHNASTDASSNFNILGSGCSIDRAYTPTFTFSGDTTWIDSIERVTYSTLRSGWTVYYQVSRNLGQSDREIYITANGVHDTDGNVYNDLVYHATQNWSAYTFLNFDKGNGYVSSARTTQTAEVVGVNTNICSVEIYSAWSQTPQYWEGVEQPTVSLLGNYLTVVWPENPYSNNRHYIVQLMVSWGEDCSNSTVLDYSMRQFRASEPSQKDIKAADADYSVGSGTGNASTTIQTSGCTYDHFTYITGGSFSVTATSGPNNTIVFTYPENPTTSPRTGYVYITFYDSDGNAYGPQTITFTQQAGSSPGPGPGPDPETGYVLTTLTISDQEQHRYFVEARPGVVYSAAGQYYKTILACEARYSLYYVNSYGGVDVLPFKEKSWKKSDTVTRFNYSRSFRNNTLEFENVNYLNSIEEEYELHTGWMSDEQSMRMHELIESTIVYLYDALEKEYIPVVMSDKKLEYKTYHNQGKKFYNYTVNCKASQSRERR